MKRIDELDFSPLRWLHIVHTVNRIKYFVRRPRRIGLITVAILIGHVIYGFVQNQDRVSVLTSFFIINGALLNFVLNVVLVLFLYSMMQSGISAFYSSFNYSFVKKFITKNKLSTHAKEQLDTIAPRSVSESGKYQILGEYGLSLETERGHKVEFLQFTMHIPVDFKPYFYFMSVKCNPGKKKMAHFYLDSYKNGRSIMRLLKKESMKLEGDFSKYFRLYHKIGKETEAREVLTPDVMELLKEIKQPYDYEFDGESVWIIAKGYHCTEQDIKLLAKTADRLAHELK